MKSSRNIAVSIVVVITTLGIWEFRGGGHGGAGGRGVGLPSASLAACPTPN